MDCKRTTYKKQSIYRIPGDDFYRGDHFLVCFRDGSRSKLTYFPKELIDIVTAKGYFEGFYDMDVWDRSGMQVMTTENVRSLIGKRIYFYCQQHYAYEDREGILTITAVDESKRNLITCKLEKCNDEGLKDAFIGCDGQICLGDYGRVVKFQVL